MTDVEVAFEQIVQRGVARDADDVVNAALNAAAAPVSVPRRRLARVVVAAAAVLVVATTAVAVYVRSRVGDIERVDVAAALSDVTPAAGQPMTVLVVGVDRRLDGAPDRGAPDVGRADVIMLARFDPRAHSIAFLSVPRDVRVRIPGTDRDDRINTAYAEGPAQLIDAVATVTGIRPDHYVEVDFAGFARLVDAVGGVTLPFAAPMRDRLSGFEVDAGCQTLDGVTALAFARARHLETLEPDGHYSTDPTGDLGRIQRQDALILAALADFPARVADHPTRLNRVVEAVAEAVTLDARLSIRSFVDRVRAFTDNPPSRSFLLVPTTAVMVDGAAFLQVETAQLPPVLKAFETPPEAEPTDGPACP
ncbi:MAG: hypothetical protein QOI61_1524 [Actinomycetota bacterium]|jgi:LCP family protein required for cell wall assembly